MKYLGINNLNLGIPTLWLEWKEFLNTRYLLDDVIAGITIAFVAIPLSLAIALASGVPAGTGLITAIVAGLVCALFGGSRLSVSGPAAAMSVLVADVAAKFGLEALICITLMTGVLQLMSGFLGIGKLARYVPLPVISGFTAGIGVIILVGQLPRAFGLVLPPDISITTVFSYISANSSEISYTCLSLVVLTIVIIRGLPLLFPRVPSILPAVITVGLIAYFFGFTDVPVIGEVPHTLPMPHLPAWPAISFHEFMFNSFAIYLLASLETLLSTTAIDKITNDKKHDSNQELIGQGLGNIVVSFFSGMPVTAVIARSMTNVRAGAKTRRSSIIHSIVLLLAVLMASSVIAHIPIVALSGVLFSVAYSMINFREFRELWQTARPEAVIYAVTFFVIIFFDLIAGFQVGIIVASAILLLKATRTNLHITSSSRDNVIRLSLSGTLTFLSSGNLAELEKKLHNVKPGQMVLLDLSQVTNIDSSGASSIIDLFTLCKNKQISFYLKGLHKQFESMFRMLGGTELLEHYYVVSERELHKKEKSADQSSIGRLVHGVLHFYQYREKTSHGLFEGIGESQDPHTLFITCSDSRLIPSLITSSDPGELFIVRNVGNVVPPYEETSLYSEEAALEFSMTNLNITDVVICGHSNCGAAKACQSFDDPAFLLPPKLKGWIGMMHRQLIKLDPYLSTKSCNNVAKLNVLNQVDNLQKHPVIQKKMASGGLNIHAWFYDFDEHIVFEWDPEKKFFKPICEA
ncbi:MAG TPA: bifunctional SulP family inorganic anion transporter/carbonic anhydrase [Gammaproteobacteria bacterium]|jgi:carbonic anhydrase|nr:bifunctional SulP family inorganic anion transporter/carbonic anhydrase [Gammaproteobacteria bacterium]